MIISNVENIDCIEGMKQFPDDYFDLALIDPNYGIDIDKHANHGGGKRPKKKYNNIGKTWDKEPPPTEYFSELFRVSKNQIIWGANYFISRMPYDSKCWVIWDKIQEFSGADFEMAWTSFELPSKAFRKSRIEAHTECAKIHPTQKPISLYNWLLEHYSKQGDKILDTHLGSQSSRIAAYKKGFDFWGFELDETYFKQGNERFEKSIAMPLFDAPKEFSCSQLSLA